MQTGHATSEMAHFLRRIVTILVKKRNALALCLLFGTFVVSQRFLFGFSTPADDATRVFQLRLAPFRRTFTIERTRLSTLNKPKSMELWRNYTQYNSSSKMERSALVQNATTTPRRSPTQLLLSTTKVKPAIVVNKDRTQDYYKPKETKVNPHDYLLLKQPNGCNEARPFLLILVLSVHENIERRSAIRETWGAAALNGSWPNRPRDSNFTARVYFMFGRHSMGNKTLEDSLAKEASIHNDIIQEDFLDTYHNLTKKSVMGMKWASLHCPAAAFVMKSDDDTFTNVGPLVTFIKNNKDAQSKVMGVYCPHSKAYRGGRWGVSREKYPFNRFPPYTAGGPGYFFPMRFAHTLYNISQYVPEINLEDVYVTGILTKASRTIKVGYARGFQDSSRRLNNVCAIVRRTPILAVAQLTAEKIRKYWDFVETHKSC